MTIQSVSINVGAGFTPARATYQAGLERALLNQKYWDDLLEKLRKSGGGGGSDPKFDRIAVSMMLANFLSNKTVQAMIENFKNQFMKGFQNIDLTIQKSNQNVFVAGLQKIGKMFINGLTNIMSLIVRRDAPAGRLYDISQQISAFVGILSFQLNKLKEILKEDLKELIRKLDIKNKMKKIQTAITDFFVEMKEEILSVLKHIKQFFEFDLVKKIM